ncbi:MAG: 5'-3' exonuclease H3TH domain-containing protein, partial [Prevotella sp.]
MEKLFLIDAYALIFRSYYAFLKHPSLNSKGMNTSAIMGFCNTLQEIMQKEKPTYLGVAFDHGKTFRHEAFPAYKAQRDETPEDIKQSVPWIKDILKALRIPVYQADGFEADDVIGTLATKAGQAGVKTFMLTPDKDYGQLVSDNVMMYKPRHGGGYDVIDKTALTSQYGISTPDQVIDLLALMGDSADNFPGCPGVGEKTAVKLINEFGSVDALLQHTDQLKGKMKEKVEGAVDDIKMSKFLATIRTDVPIELKLDEMKVKSPDESELTKIFGELEFKRLLSKFVNKPIESQNKVNNEPDIFSLFPADSQEEDKNQSFQSLKDIAHVYKLIETEEDAQKLYDFLMTKQIISLDTETTSTNAIDAELVGLSFSVEENKAFYVAIPKDREKALRIVNIFKSLYEEPSILKVGQNIKYDYEVLCNYGVRIGGKMWDTMLAHYIIQPELKHNMDDMAEQLLHYKTIHIEELIGPKGKGQKNMADLKPEEIYEYAAEDADVTLKLKNVLQPKLKEVEGAKLFEDIEMPHVPVVAD